MARKTEYAPLGEVMDEIAYRKARVRGPYNVAKYIQEVAGRGPGGSSFSTYYHGLADPSSETMYLFREVFECSDGEAMLLAWALAFRERRFRRQPGKSAAA